MTPLEAATKAAETARKRLTDLYLEVEIAAGESRKCARKVRDEQLKELLRSKL